MRRLEMSAEWGADARPARMARRCASRSGARESGSPQAMEVHIRCTFRAGRFSQSPPRSQSREGDAGSLSALRDLCERSPCRPGRPVGWSGAGDKMGNLGNLGVPGSGTSDTPVPARDGERKCVFYKLLWSEHGATCQARGAQKAAHFGTSRGCHALTCAVGDGNDGGGAAGVSGLDLPCRWR